MYVNLTLPHLPPSLSPLTLSFWAKSYKSTSLNPVITLITSPIIKHRVTPRFCPLSLPLSLSPCRRRRRRHSLLKSHIVYLELNSFVFSRSTAGGGDYSVFGEKLIASRESRVWIVNLAKRQTCSWPLSLLVKILVVGCGKTSGSVHI